MGWGGRWEGGLGWGTHVNPWLIHIHVWQKTLQHCKVISLQLKQKKKKDNPMDRGTWQATIRKVVKSQTRLKQLSTHIYITIGEIPRSEISGTKSKMHL